MGGGLICVGGRGKLSKRWAVARYQVALNSLRSASIFLTCDWSGLPRVLIFLSVKWKSW